MHAFQRRTADDYAGLLLFFLVLNDETATYLNSSSAFVIFEWRTGRKYFSRPLQKEKLLRRNHDRLLIQLISQFMVQRKKTTALLVDDRISPTISVLLAL